MLSLLCLRQEANRRLEIRPEAEPVEATQMVQLKGQDGKGGLDRGGVCKEDTSVQGGCEQQCEVFQKDLIGSSLDSI